MNVVIVIGAFPPSYAGGGILSAKLLADKLIKQKINVSILSFDGDTSRNIDDDQYKIKRVKYKRGLFNLRKLILIKNFYEIYQIYKFSKNADITHYYGCQYIFLEAFIRIFFRKKAIITLNHYLHNYPKTVENIDSRNILYLLIRTPFDYVARIIIHHCFDQIVVISKSIRDLYADLGIKKSKMFYIPNMIDTELLNKIDRRGDKNNKHKETRLLYCGSLIKIKGVEYLIKAVSKIETNSFKLIIAGDGVEREKLENLVDTLKLKKRVEFLGFMPHNKLGDLYQQADIFIHPSIWPEAFGRSIMEAMQFGLPVIVTDIGAQPELIGNKKLVCKPGDPNSLTEKIELLINHKEYRKNVGRENRIKILKNYSQTNSVQKYINIYKHVIQQ